MNRTFATVSYPLKDDPMLTVGKISTMDIYSDANLGSMVLFHVTSLKHGISGFVLEVE